MTLEAGTLARLALPTSLLIVAAALAQMGRYELHPAGLRGVALAVQDRWTGEVKICTPTAGGHTQCSPYLAAGMTPLPKPSTGPAKKGVSDEEFNELLERLR